MGKIEANPYVEDSKVTVFCAVHIWLRRLSKIINEDNIVPMKLSEYYTVEQVAEFFRVTRSTVANAISRGTIKNEYFGKKKVVIHKNEIERLGKSWKIRKKIIKRPSLKPGEYYTIDQVAEILGITISIIYNAIGLGVIKVEYLDKKKIAIHESQIEQLKEADSVSVASASAATAESQEVGELESLAQIEQDFKKIRSKYVNYADKEDSVLQSQGEGGLLETKLYLDEFLTYKPMEASFPGLWRRIKKYDQAFENEGRKAALQDVIDIVYDLSSVVGDSQRVALLEDEISRNSRNPLARELLVEIKDLIQN